MPELKLCVSDILTLNPFRIKILRNKFSRVIVHFYYQSDTRILTSTFRSHCARAMNVLHSATSYYVCARNNAQQGRENVSLVCQLFIDLPPDYCGNPKAQIGNRK